MTFFGRRTPLGIETAIIEILPFLRLRVGARLLQIGIEARAARRPSIVLTLKLGVIPAETKAPCSSSVQSGGRAESWSAHQGAVLDAAMSADGRWMVSGGQDGTVRVWERLLLNGEPSG
jgi:hypothetical protein